jgi:uncharacterized membrane protein
MILVVSRGAFRLRPPIGTGHPDTGLTRQWEWPIPVLCLIGLGLAGYLTYVETTQVQAVCGPVGDCNTVQQSEYARLFGVLPIGIICDRRYLCLVSDIGDHHDYLVLV